METLYVESSWLKSIKLASSGGINYLLFQKEDSAVLVVHPKSVRYFKSFREMEDQNQAFLSSVAKLDILNSEIALTKLIESCFVHAAESNTWTKVVTDIAPYIYDGNGLLLNARKILDNCTDLSNETIKEDILNRVLLNGNTNSSLLGIYRTYPDLTESLDVKSVIDELYAYRLKNQELADKWASFGSGSTRALFKRTDFKEFATKNEQPQLVSLIKSHIRKLEIILEDAPVKKIAKPGSHLKSGILGTYVHASGIFTEFPDYVRILPYGPDKFDQYKAYYGDVAYGIIAQENGIEARLITYIDSEKEAVFSSVNSGQHYNVKVDKKPKLLENIILNSALEAKLVSQNSENSL